MVMFLNRQDRNNSCMKEAGYEYREVRGPLEGAVKDKLVNTTVDGFHPPKEMKPRQSYGIFSNMFGSTPKNRVLDIRLGMDYLAKDVYEMEMDILAANARLAEFKTLLHFAREDEAKASEQTGGGCSQDGENQKADRDDQKADRENRKADGNDQKADGNVPKGSHRGDKKRRRRAKVELSAGQEAIRNAITWRYNWIQAYKKDCYLFAQYKAEELLSGRRTEKYLEAFSPEARAALLSFAEKYGTKSGVVESGEPKPEELELAEPDVALCEKIGISSDQVKNFCWLTQQTQKQVEFCEEFIQMASELPEPNRRLLDRMYETAWHLYFRFALGVEPEHIPAPWYDTPGAVPDEVPEENTPGESIAQSGNEDATEAKETKGTEETEDDMEYWG